MANLPRRTRLAITALAMIGVIVVLAWVSLAWLLSYSD